MKSNSLQFRSSERLKTLSNTAGSIQKSKSLSPVSSKSGKVSKGDPRRSPRFLLKSADSLKHWPQSSGTKRKVFGGAPGNAKRLKDSEEKSIEDMDADRHLASDSSLTGQDDFIDSYEDDSWRDATTEDDDDVRNHQVAVLESESNSQVESASELQMVDVSLEASKTVAVNESFNSGSELHVTTGDNSSRISFENEDQAMEAGDENSVNLEDSSEGESDQGRPSQFMNFTGQNTREGFVPAMDHGMRALMAHPFSPNRTFGLSSINAVPCVYFRDEIQGEGDTPIRQQCSCGLNQRYQSEEENEFRIFLALVLLKFGLLMCELIAAIM